MRQMACIVAGFRAAAAEGGGPTQPVFYSG